MFLNEGVNVLISGFDPDSDIGFWLLVFKGHTEFFKTAGQELTRKCK